MHALTTRTVGQRPLDLGPAAAHPLGSCAVVVPGRYALGPSHATYVRRRILVCAFLATLALSLGAAVQHGLADRGGDPASAPTIGRSTAATYVVHSGDTLWEIAERMHPGDGLTDYVDALVALNGGSTVIAEGQVLRLP